MKKERRLSHEERHQQLVDEYNEHAKEYNQRYWPECSGHLKAITDLYRSVYGNKVLPDKVQFL